ncbi:DNA topoisomerase 3-alpha isoform X2 [Telopea speciosissima]|uniref:DNA topoisomerase 3-alpha isoform X2 n=1 Tax=Telopea speciosissima TaxID=54955 RepID=UPI001CC82AE8|nr:DNA topoisomerase 3-alpha isoform X2 [Telopea speciosissima]
MAGGGGGSIMVLNVAEKPSVAKAVAGILSRNQGLRVREGRSRYNKIFEFDYTIRGQRCHMLFTSVTGHLMELEFEERYRKWHSCDPADLYHAPVRKFVPQDKLDIKKTLEEEARKCQWLVLWLDCDREGENISFEVVETCTAVNRYLNVWRARFSALIDREIHESVQTLVRPNQLFSDAVDVRQEIDLRIGASFTRFQTMLLKDAFTIDVATDERNLVISYGPCQFPTLGFVVERYWEIQSHEPEEFWTINCSHSSDEGIATFSWMRGHLFDYMCAVIIYEMCILEPTATVTKVRHHEKLKYPPHPLNTIELEKRASRYFRMSSEHTMKVAEELYQAGFISYPRTETDGFSARTDLHGIVQEQERHPVWGPYAQRLLDPGAGLWRNPTGGGHDDKAHPPIHPTKFSGGESGWSQDHHRLYELVVRHFLACVSQPAIGAETTIEIDIAGESFSACGRVIIAKNYLDVYRFESWGGSVIPTYVVGQQFNPTTLTLDPGVTRPPPLLSEADLLTCMDKAGIGTDATMHDHIKKLLDRFYATKDQNTRFSPTNLGEALVMGYDDMGYELWKPYLRSMMECDMKEVSLGSKRRAEVLETCLQQMKACFLDARLNKAKLLEAMAIFFERSNRPGRDEQNLVVGIVRPCGACQESNMVLKRKPDGNFMVGCMGFPQCRNVIWLPGSISEAVVTSQVCNSCTPGPVYKIQFKFRRLEIPPDYNVDHLGCIGGCDETLRQLTEICGTGPHNLSNMTARGQGSAATTSNSQRTTSRQRACVHCGQSGHSSNNCSSQTSRSQRIQPRGTNLQNGESSIPCNLCRTPCILRTANTANNRGRKFYKCQSQDCYFFMWEDSIGENNGGIGGRGTTRANSRSANSNSRSSRTGGRGRGGRSGARTTEVRFVSATGEPISGRSCYVCGDPSHFANVCPNRGT